MIIIDVRGGRDDETYRGLIGGLCSSRVGRWGRLSGRLGGRCLKR